MTELLGLVASVIQVTGAGLKLSQTLYHYADGVATADRRLKDIAKEIQLTSFVIEELGTIFTHDETSTLMSQNAVRTADATMKECSTVFAEIDATLKKSKKNTFGKLLLPFRDNKIELLRSHIDKLKSTLQLLMQVLTHAHQVAAKKLDREAEAKQREEIKELLELKKKSTEKYEQSLRDYSVSEGSTVLDKGTLDDDPDVDEPSKDLVIAAEAIGSTINVKTLDTCVQHIRTLLGDIEALQNALDTKKDGDDHSAYHQSLLGSYFQTREHLDNVLLGNSKATQKTNGSLGAMDLVASNEKTEIEVGIHHSFTGSTLHNELSQQASSYNVSCEPTQEDGRKTHREELERLQREVEKIRTEKEVVEREMEEKTFQYERLLKETSQRKLESTLPVSHMPAGDLKLSDSSRTREQSVSQTTITTDSSDDEIRIRVDAFTPIALTFNGDMEGQTLQLLRPEDGMADVVIDNIETTCHTKQGSKVGGRRTIPVVNDTARREPMSMLSKRGGRGRRVRDKVRDRRDDHRVSRSGVPMRLSLEHTSDSPESGEEVFTLQEKTDDQIPPTQKVKTLNARFKDLVATKCKSSAGIPSSASHSTPTPIGNEQPTSRPLESSPPSFSSHHASSQHYTDPLLSDPSSSDLPFIGYSYKRFGSADGEREDTQDITLEAEAAAKLEPKDEVDELLREWTNVLG